MPVPPTEHFANFHAIRPVLADSSIEQYMATVNKIAMDIFGPKDSAVVIESSPEEELERGERDITTARVPWEIYAVNTLRATLFERRARAGENMGSLFVRAKGRLERPARRRTSDEFDEEDEHADSNLSTRFKVAAVNNGLSLEDANYTTVRLAGIDRTINPDYAGRGVEFGLKIDPSTPEGDFVYTQADIVYSAIASLGYGQRIIGPIQSRTGLWIPITRTPPNATQKQREAYFQKLSINAPILATLGLFDITVNNPQAIR